MENPKTETQEEVKARIDVFIKEYGELVAKHGIDFASYPVYVPDGAGAFKTVLQNTPIDIKNQPKPSPFVVKE